MWAGVTDRGARLRNAHDNSPSGYNWHARRLLGADVDLDSLTDAQWAQDVLQSTAFTAGEGVLIDTRLLGKVAVRETLSLRIGYSGTDFTANVVRTICEERLNLAVERPAAICHITGLPATAPTATTKRSSK
jgi:hypothetical protein